MAWVDDVTALARARGPALVGYAFLLTGSVETAEDLVQESLVRAYALRPRRDQQLSEAYLRRTVLNLFVDQHRRGSRWQRVRHLIALPEADSARTGDPAATVAERLDVRAALAALPARERACVVLRFFEDLTVPAMADELGISVGATKRYLSDGVRRLEAALGPVSDASRPDADGIEHLVEGSNR